MNGMRLIDADALVYKLTEMVRHSTGEYKYGIDAARLVVMDAPTVAKDTNALGKSMMTCKDICKHAPPGNKWPCIDCDMRVRDRAEPPEEDD